MDLLREEGGQVTVFLTLMFCLLLGICFLTLEGVHAYENSQLGEEAVLSAGESLLANYDRALFSRYHVFFLDPRERDYLNKDGRAYLEDYFKENSFYGVSCESIEVSQEVGALDYEGLPVLAQMKRWVEEGSDEGKEDQVIKRAQKLRKIQERCRESLAGWGGNSGHDHGREETDPEGEDEFLSERIQAKELKEAVEMIMRSGPVFYAMDEERGISALSIELAGMPSEQAGKEPDAGVREPVFSFADPGTLDSMIPEREAGSAMKGFIYSYMDDCFACYTDPLQEGRALAYGKEYLIGGMSSDQDNLRIVTDRIFEMRFLINYACAKADPFLRDRALALAAGIAGEDGWPPSQEETVRLLLGALSYGESAIELREVLCGRKLALEKRPGSFCINFENGPDKIRGKAGRGAGDGAGYEELLDSLLIMEKEDVCLFRMMDLMEADTALEETGFKMRDCLYGMELKTRLSMPAWFVSLPGFGKAFPQFRDMTIRKIISYR